MNYVEMDNFIMYQNKMSRELKQLEERIKYLEEKIKNETKEETKDEIKKRSK